MVVAWSVADCYVRDGYLLAGEGNTQKHNLTF